MAKFIIGTVAALVGGTITLSMPVRCNYWFIQNQSDSPLVIGFKPDSVFGKFSSIILNPSPGFAENGPAGGIMNSVGFPYFDDLILTSTNPTAAFGSGGSPFLPCNMFPYPGNQNFLNGNPVS